jgi:integrase/recombinase XerD
MKSKITFSQALTGYEMAANARRLSQHTIAEYKNTFRRFTEFLAGDPAMASITREQVTHFLASRDDVSGKTLLNYHTGLSALWTWAASEKIVPENIIHLVDRPKSEQRVIQPLTELEIRGIMNALTYTNLVQQPGKRAARRKLPDAERDQAIVLLLLDTGLRASELCDLPIHRVDLKSPNKGIAVRNGKGGKDRHIPISARTGQAIWKYLTTRKEARLDEPLFVTEHNRPLDRTQLGKMLAHAGEKAGIADVHPHRFRHSFAIMFLRNGGDIYTLQAILGHSTLEMIKTYLQISQTDVDAAHRKASPVDNMRL